MNNSRKDGNALKRASIPRSVFQFRIKLVGTEICRVIQVKDSILDKLHEHIQTSMGWTNSHLHRFKIEGRYFGDPDLLEEDFEEMNCRCSRTTRLSKIFVPTNAPLSFQYEYDFGDGWKHEIVFEGLIEATPGIRYPVCLDGMGKCPPEDVGGVPGLRKYLKVIGNLSHKKRDEMLRWSGPFDTKDFDASKATKTMQKGLPDWRKLERDLV